MVLRDEGSEFNELVSVYQHVVEASLHVCEDHFRSGRQDLLEEERDAEGGGVAELGTFEPVGGSQQSYK